MLHMTKDATVQATDQGEFTAIVAAYTTDRGGDRIMPGAFARTIEQWQTSGKQLPLHWNHQGEPEDIIGSVDPFSMKEIPDQGLQISGRVDLENSDKAREAWRAMKTGSMSLSFGYLIPDGKASKSETDDGVTDLHEIDMFEASIVPAPMHPGTRVLNMKSAEAGAILDELRNVRVEVAELAARFVAFEEKTADTARERSGQDPLQQKAMALALEMASGGLPLPPQEQETVRPTAGPEMDPKMLEEVTRNLMLQTLTGGTS